MILRSVKPEEIETLKALTPNDQSFYTDDIWCEQSKVCTDDEGGILGFALVKPHSIYDFFGGEVPAEGGVEEEMKWLTKKDIDYFKDSQYEVFFYMKSMEGSEENDEIYLNLFNGIEHLENKSLIGLLWTPKIIEYDWRFYHFNDMVYLWFSYLPDE